MLNFNDYSLERPDKGSGKRESGFSSILIKLFVIPGLNIIQVYLYSPKAHAFNTSELTQLPQSQWDYVCTELTDNTWTTSILFNIIFTYFPWRLASTHFYISYWSGSYVICLQPYPPLPTFDMVRFEEAYNCNWCIPSNPPNVETDFVLLHTPLCIKVCFDANYQLFYPSVSLAKSF